MPTLSQLVEILNSVCDYYISTEEINPSKTIYSYIKQLAEKYNEIHYQKQILVYSVDKIFTGIRMRFICVMRIRRKRL